MMNTYLVIATILINIVSIAVIYKIIKKLDSKEKLIFIAINIAVMYILVSIVYWLSGFGVAENIHNASKNFVIYLFVPINVILFVPYIASKYMKLKNKEIKRESLKKKAIILTILLAIVLIIEYFYFGNIQKNIANISENAVENSINSNLQQNTIKNEIQTESTEEVKEEAQNVEEEN